MPAPTSYTEDTLADFMQAVLKSVATDLTWTDTADYQEAINETLLAYGAADIADASNITKLRLLARREVWRAVAEETAGHTDVDVSSGPVVGVNAKLSQIHTHALGMIKLAEQALTNYNEESRESFVGPTSGSVSNKAVW